MSSCFFSSRLKMRTARTSVVSRRRNTALPKEPVPPVIITVRLSSNCAAQSGGTVRVHLRDQVRPGGRDVARGSAKPAGVERSVDPDRIVGHDVNLLTVDPRDDTQKVKLRDRLGRHVIKTAQVGSWENVVPHHAGEFDPWKPRVDRLRVPAHGPGFSEEPLKQ